MTTAEYQQIVRGSKMALPKFSRHVLPRGMNKLEAAYGRHLSLRKTIGEILWFSFEVVKVRLADGANYKPDFLILFADGHLEAHETKGFMREAAQVRLKVAADVLPIRFVLVKRVAGLWQLTERPGLVDVIGGQNV